MAALVLAEHDNLSLKGSTLHTISAALQCDATVDLLIAGFHCTTVVEAAAKTAGIRRILVADAEPFANGLAENVAEQLLSVAKNYAYILAPATAYGKNVLPRVAALLDVSQISEITKVLSPDTFERPVYAGNAITTVQSMEAIKVITVRTTAFEAASAGSGAQTEAMTPVTTNSRSEFISREIAKSERPELSGAKIIISGGRGMGSGENFKILEPLADRLGAALGASRAAVDAGFVPNDWQIGQTGKVVAPQLYIAVGISGAIQHLAGMKDSKVIVAINKDPDAPIFSVADYGLVGDLFELIPQLLAELK